MLTSLDYRFIEVKQKLQKNCITEYSCIIARLILIQIFCHELSKDYMYGTAHKQLYIKMRALREPCKIFKNARELLVSTRASLAEHLRVSASYLHVHDYCTSAKYSRAFVHVARTQALASLIASSANVCQKTATYVCLRE